MYHFSLHAVYILSAQMKNFIKSTEKIVIFLNVRHSTDVINLL